jgi:glutamate-1-semialdehyde 2,1-aminomutase
MILGHAHPANVEAVLEDATHGTSYGAPCEAEVELAGRVVKRIPAVEQERF